MLPIAAAGHCAIGRGKAGIDEGFSKAWRTASMSEKRAHTSANNIAL
jgi:hypothetical protein